MTDFKKVAVLDNQTEAKLMESVLNERGIPHIIKSYYDSAYDGLFQAQKGWGHIAAEEEHKEEIKAILNELRNMDPSEYEDLLDPDDEQDGD
jgi:hypothetical protein